MMYLETKFPAVALSFASSPGLMRWSIASTVADISLSGGPVSAVRAFTAPIAFWRREEEFCISTSYLACSALSFSSAFASDCAFVAMCTFANMIPGLVSPS